MLGLFGLLFGVAWFHDQRISWQMGSIMLMASLALFYLAFTHRRFDSWVEFSNCLKMRDFFGIHTYHWREVAAISLEFSDEGKDVKIMLTNNKTIEMQDGPETLRDIATSLVTRLSSEEPDTREAAIDGLDKLGCVNCYYSGSGVSGIHDFHPSPSEVVEMRKEIISHLEKALEDSNENVRAAATDALLRIQSAVRRDEESREPWLPHVYRNARDK